MSPRIGANWYKQTLIMIKKFLLPLSFIFSLYSCSPSSKGTIQWRDKPPCHSCAYLLNSSSNQKITFVVKSIYTKADGTESENTYEQPVGPQEEAVLGCDRDYPDTTTKINFQIVSAYIKN